MYRIFSKKVFSTVNNGSSRTIGFPPLIICGPSGCGKVKNILNQL